MIHFGQVGFQVQLAIDRAQEQPAAMRPADEIAVLPLPAQTGRHRQRLFHHRRGVHEDLKRARLLLDQPASEALQSFFHDVMIVAPLCVDGNASTCPFPRQRQRVAARSIAHPQHDDAAYFGPQRVWRAALLRALLHP